MNQAASQSSPFTMTILMLLMFIPFIILIVIISKRKGKNPLIYALLSFIPFVGFFLIIYLASLTDYSVNEKIEKLMKLIEKE